MDDKRLTILKEITAVLEGVTPANGYQHDLTGKVFRGLPPRGDDASFPQVIVCEWQEQDPDTRPSDNSARVRNETWRLMIEGVAVSEDFGLDTAYRLMADVKKVMASIHINPESNPFDGLINKLSVFPGFVPFPDPEKPTSTCKFLLPFTVEFVEWTQDPYQLRKI